MAPLQTLLSPANIITALAVMNFLAFAAFGIDKARAEQGAWRIREETLLQLAFFGGTLGAYAGRAVFRHKTRQAAVLRAAAFHRRAAIVRGGVSGGVPVVIPAGLRVGT